MLQQNIKLNEEEEVLNFDEVNIALEIGKAKLIKELGSEAKVKQFLFRKKNTLKNKIFDPIPLFVLLVAVGYQLISNYLLL